MICTAFLIAVLSLTQQMGERQPPARSPAPAAPSQAATAPAPSAPAPGPYVYNPEGRRDPFVSLIGRGNEPQQHAARPAGLPGVLVAELTVKGIMRDKSGFIAMVQTADNKTFIVRPGDKLMDGVVKNITQDTVIFSQDVNDPLSLVKQREVPKRVRGAEGRG